MIICIWLFWTLPFVYKWTGSLQLSALISVELLAFTSLFGCLLLRWGEFAVPAVVNHQPVAGLLLSVRASDPWSSDYSSSIFSASCPAYFVWGFPELVPHEELATVGWISILSATIYMSWMAIYYANMIAMRSETRTRS